MEGGINPCDDDVATTAAESIEMLQSEFPQIGKFLSVPLKTIISAFSLQLRMSSFNQKRLVFLNIIGIV